MKEISGVLTAMVTPFDREGRLNLKLIPEYLAFQKAGGVEGIVPCGTNGEATSLSVDERKSVLETVLANRGDLLVVAGTGAASVTDAVELTRHASDAGADGVLVLPQFFYKNVSAQGLAAYFRRVMDASRIPVLLYNIPQQTAVPITDELLDLLRDHPRMAGIKDSAGNWERTSALIQGNPALRIFCGADELLSRALQAGGAGGISGTANGFPELVSGVKRGTAERRGEEAQAKLDAAKNVLLQYPLIAVNKSVLAHRGVGRMHVRPPLVDLTAQQELDLITRLGNAGVLS